MCSLTVPGNQTEYLHLKNAYAGAKDLVMAAGYSEEILWQASRNPEGFTETDLLREAAWVILCSGFRESVVRKMFAHISLCFCDWESSAAIVASADACVATALARFNNGRKIRAICEVAERIAAFGFGYLRKEIIADPIETLGVFPFIGPRTVRHLAKNLGFLVAKPDRHLEALARRFGFSDVQAFCSVVARLSNDPVTVVDIVFWRVAVITRGAFLDRGLTCAG